MFYFILWESWTPNGVLGLIFENSFIKLRVERFLLIYFAKIAELMELFVVNSFIFFCCGEESFGVGVTNFSLFYFIFLS